MQGHRPEVGELLEAGVVALPEEVRRVVGQVRSKVEGLLVDCEDHAGSFPAKAGRDRTIQGPSLPASK